MSDTGYPLGAVLVRSVLVRSVRVRSAFARSVFDRSGSTHTPAGLCTPAFALTATAVSAPGGAA